MKSKPEVEDLAITRRGVANGTKTEFSPVRTQTSGGRGARQPNITPRNSKRTSGGPGGGASPSPGGRASSNNSSPGPGRTPQTKRRELSLTSAVTEKNSPTGSPRSVKPNNSIVTTRKSCHNKTSKSDSNREVIQSHTNYEESSRKSSASSQDSGIGRETKLSVRIDKPNKGIKGGRQPPIIRTVSPDLVDLEVSNRKKFSELCDVKNIELGIVKVPPELLEDLIQKEKIDKFYTVDQVPVASGLFATVRKCTNKETGIEYAAKFSSRFRCGVDCTTEVLHEIALLSICSESNKIVHLKDVFQNQHEIILVLEYAPGGDFQSVLDDDMVPFEQDVQGFMQQLLEALSYIHERNIAHLDIKPQNIVLMSEFPNCEIKLCDLEVSRVIQDNEEIREIIGTPDYVAPEILAYEPISLSADVWSLGVLAYVLLTGFSPFGGDTDQETLRNITSANLDFPAELFDGVSEEAKDFIAECLQRDPLKRPTVSECLSHPWLSENSEPPSPSPLMLKIPTPEHHFGSVGHSSPAKLSLHTPSGFASGSSRRSCHTCRDKITERKRYLSKSREAIFEKVANSNLKKSLSKSRERLCDMRMTLSKSRDYLNESKIASRSQEKFYSFKSLSKSQEVLSQALGGNMKRMVNGAVSDISHAHLPINQRTLLEPVDTIDNLVILPGSSVLMSHADLLNFSKSASSLQLLGESGRSTPASISSYDANPSEQPNNERPSSAKPETVIEVSEEDLEEEENTNGKEWKNINNSLSNLVSIEDTVSFRKKSQGAYLVKEEKDSINYETKQRYERASSIDKIKAETAEVAIQVDLNKIENIESSKKEDPIDKQETDDSNRYIPLSFPEFNANLHMAVDGNIRGEKKLTRGFSHDDTLGDEQKRHSWREELERFRQMKKPLGVSDLIDAFSNKPSAKKISEEDLSFVNIDSLKNKRRGSLQIHLDSSALANLAETSDKNEKNAIKLQRRKSTSAILPVRIEDNKMQNNVENKVVEEVQKRLDVLLSNNCDDEENIPDLAVSNKENYHTESEVNKLGSLTRGQAYLDKVNERKRTWDYFEINHPKAISDKKLEQLKAKYTRRKTETSLSKTDETTSTVLGENSKEEKIDSKVKIQSRTISMPIIEGISALQIPSSSNGLDLAWDPLTGESIAEEGSGKICDSLSLRKVSSEIDLRRPEKVESSQRKSTRRKSSHLGDILEQEKLPGNVVLECFIDPFTGHFITKEISKQSSRPHTTKDCKDDSNEESQVIPAHTTNGHPTDDGINKVENRTKHMLSDIEEVLPNHREHSPDIPNQTE